MNMYLTKDAHPPIITHEEAEAVRSIMEYRSRTLNMNGERSQSRYIFSSRIICGDCGSHFRRQKINIGKPYEKIIWTCHRHVEDKESCHMKAIREDVLQQAFIDMWNKLLPSGKLNGHGIGLKNVEAVAEKYDGSIAFDCDEKEFKAVMIL